MLRSIRGVILFRTTFIAFHESQSFLVFVNQNNLQDCMHHDNLQQEIIF